MRKVSLNCLFSRLRDTAAHLLDEDVARRGGLQRVSEARLLEVRSDRTPQPEL